MIESEYIVYSNLIDSTIEGYEVLCLLYVCASTEDANCVSTAQGTRNYKHYANGCYPCTAIVVLLQLHSHLTNAKENCDLD